MAAPVDPPPDRAGLRPLARDLLSFDRRAAAILVWVPIAMTLMEFVFLPQTPYKRPNPAWTNELLASIAARFPSVPRDLWKWLWWVAGCLSTMVVAPMILLKVVAGAGPRDAGVRLSGTGRDGLVYALLFLIFAPVIYLASTRADFQGTYPFYPPRGRPLGADWIAFELAYFLQFFSVEYFFRGVMVLGLRPALGRASILVMLAPYCMIHFHKPMLEALGAIGAGAVLGCLSYRTRTVLYGWWLHYAVALSMDLLALWQSGRLG